MSSTPLLYLVALCQAGFELHGNQMRTRTKRMLAVEDVDATGLSRDSLRYMAWDLRSVRAQFDGLDGSAGYELEVIAVSENGTPRRQRLSLGGSVIDAFDVPPGAETVKRVRVPAAAITGGLLDVEISGIEGPDVVVSELRLYGTHHPGLTVTAVGDSCGGLIVSVAAPDFVGVAEASLDLTGDGVAFTAVTDSTGFARIPAWRSAAGHPAGGANHSRRQGGEIRIDGD